MKKILLLFAALVIAFSLAACGESKPADDPLGRRDDSASGSQTDGGAQGIRDGAGLTLQAILMYAETGNTEFFRPRVLTAAEQAELRADVEKQGGSVAFDADGTIHITGSGSGRLTVRPDGSVDGVDDDGMPFGFSNGTDWPESALGSAVPKADFEIKMRAEDGESLMMMFGNVTLEQAKEYGKSLAAAGFTVDSSELEMSSAGMYGYSGKNSSGLSVDFNYMETDGGVTCALTVENEKHGETPGYDDTDPSGGPQGDLPPEFSFLLPDGSGGYSVIDCGYYTSVRKENSSVSEARSFAALCQSNGFAEYSTDEGQNSDGSYSYAAIYTKGDLQVIISFNVIEKDKLFVNVSVADDPVDPEIPAGTDPWPDYGPLTRVPKPGFGTGFSIRDFGNQIAVNVTGATAADFAPYVQKLVDAGFTASPDYDDDDDVKFYAAYDSDGYAAYVQWAEGVFVIGVSAEAEEQ